MASVDDFGDELPTDDKTSTSTGHIADHNKLTRELGEVQSVVTQIVTGGFGIVGVVDDVGSLPTTGTAGQMYLLGNTGNMYNWVEESWAYVGNIKGTAGDQGDPGTIVGILASGETEPPSGTPAGTLWFLADEPYVPSGGPSYATPSVVGIATKAYSSSTQSFTMNMPGGLSAGDLAIMTFGYTPQYNTPTVSSSGWTQQGTTMAYSSTFETQVWTKVLDGTETTLTLSSSPSGQRFAAAVVVVDGVTGVVNRGQDTTGASSTTKVAPATTHTDYYVTVGAWMERTTTSTSVLAPTGFPTTGAAFATGSGAVSIAVGVNVTPVTGGASTSPGNWVSSPSYVAGTIVWTAAVEVAQT